MRANLRHKFAGQGTCERRFPACPAPSPALRKACVSRAQAPAVGQRQHSLAHAFTVRHFDVNNPEVVYEVVIKEDRRNSSLNASSSNGNGTSSINEVHSHASSNGVANGNGNGHVQLTTAKDQGQSGVQLHRLNVQLDEARGAIAKLQQYEALYKESRMRAKQWQAEVANLQNMLADKDQELARQYRRMELEAKERSGLRTQFSTAVDEVKALRNELEEARQAMLELRGVIPPNITLQRVGSSLRSPAAQLEDGAGSPDVLSSLQGLARTLAEGMEQEVGTLFTAASSNGKRD